MTDLTLSGTTAGQPVTDMASLSPLSAVTVTGPAGVYTTVNLVLSSTANGALSHLGVGVLSADGSTYTVSGSTADVQTALRGLVFTPVAHEVAVGSAVTTGFTLTASDAAGAVTDARTTVVATAADTPPTITDNSATQAPGNNSTLASQTFAPFRYVSIADPNSGAVETTTVTLAQNGAATDAVGMLSGAGLTKSGTGTYTLASAGPAAETAALQALGFTPASPGTAAALGVTISVSDGAGPAVTASTTLGLVGNTGAKTVVTNSAEALTVYNDTASSQVTHTYATTIEAVLNGASVVYDQSFSLPYSDPQVQAAVAQAQAALQNAGASAGSPSQTASNLTTLSSLATAAETGRSTTPTAYQTTTAFGPGFVGPNVDVTAADNTEADRGFFYVQNGQTNINIDAATTTTVSRTVTTTATDLLSQQYVITGTTMATPASTTTLISSSAAGVEGNAASETNNTAGSFTADGLSVLFTSTATNLTPGVTNANGELYLKNTSTGAITLVSTNAAGALPNTGVSYGSVDGDGNLVAFATTSTNLDARAADGNYHTFVRNVAAGTLTLIAPTDYAITSAVTGAVEASTSFAALNGPSISGDGRYIAVQAFSGGGLTTLLLDTLSHTGVDLNAGSGNSTTSPAISRDGSTVVFSTSAMLQPAGALPVDMDARADVYAYSVATHTLQLVSDTQGANAPSVKGNGASYYPSVSSDGSHVAFATQSTNFDSRDTDVDLDIYVKNLTTGGLVLADVTAAGVKANADAYTPSLSADGTMVAFESQATNLVAGVTDGLFHAYVKNLTTGALTLVDQSTTGGAGNAGAQNPVLSPDGSHAAFFSGASNLVANDMNGAPDVFLTAIGTAATPPAAVPPTITGVPATEVDLGGATVKPFAGATVTDTNAGATITVTLQAGALVNGVPVVERTPGTFTGGGFTSDGQHATFTSTSVAAVQAALQAVSFTPSDADGQIFYGISDSTGGVSTAFVDVLSNPVTPTNTAPSISGAAANQPTTDKATISPFSAATVTDPDANQTETVTVAYAAANGVLAGAGFTGSNGSLTGTFTGAGAGQAAAAAQAALQGLVFTPTANEVTPGQAVSTGFTVSVSDGQAAATSSATSVAATSVNDPPVLAGVAANQVATAGAAITPFAAATIADPDTGQTETVAVSFVAGAGAFAAEGFTGSGGSYSGTFASAATAQAALQASSFTPAAGVAATDTLSVSVQDAPDGGAPATGATVLAVSYTPSGSGGGGAGDGGEGGGGSVSSTPLSVQYGLLTEFQNLERALATGADALTPGTPIAAAFAAEKAIAAQLDNGQLSLAQAEGALAHLVDGTTAVAVADYAFFTSATPAAQGLNYLVHSPANATDLNDAYYAQFSTENRYINFAVNLATGQGAGAAAFQAAYGSLSLSDAVTQAYLAVFGATADPTKVSAILNGLVPDGLGGQETRAAYFASYGGDGPNGQGTKAAAIGFLLAQAVETGSGVYGAATENYLASLAHGTAPATGSELALHYGAAVSLVGVTPLADPAVTG